jgi:carboxyl-terminal processing protease
MALLVKTGFIKTIAMKTSVMKTGLATTDLSQPLLPKWTARQILSKTLVSKKSLALLAAVIILSIAAQRSIAATNNTKSAPELPAVDAAPTTNPNNVDAAPLPIDAMRRFVDVYEKVRQNYVEPVSDDVLFDNALSGLLNKLDPYSDYLDAQTYDAIVDFTDGELGQTGLGIQQVVMAETSTPDSSNDKITPNGTQNIPQWQITNVPKGSPAAKAGIQVGDILLKIDGKSVKLLNQGDIEQLLRGPRNSVVKLSVMQAGKHARDVRVLLAIPEDNAVKALVQPNGIVAIQLRAFQTQTGTQITDVLDPMYKTGKLKGIVLDLRDNPGGLLSSAIEVANFFLNDGLIVYTQGRGEPEKYYRVITPERYPNIPVSILINHYSASAAEVLTAALRDHLRATVYGTTSYGKGSVQKIWPIGQGRAIKMTVSRYFTPKGRMIEGTGITPDVTVPSAELKPVRSTGDSIDLQDAALLKVVNAMLVALTPVPLPTPAIIKGTTIKSNKSTLSSAAPSQTSQPSLGTKKLTQAKSRTALTANTDILENID